MKFGKTVVAVLAEFPEEIRENCLSYSLWKKRAHDPKILTAVSWKIRLARDCGRLDTFLKSKQGVFDAQLLERVAVINTDILYKLCKRLQKRTGVPALEHYGKLLRTRRYAFTRCSSWSLLPESDGYRTSLAQRGVGEGAANGGDSSGSAGTSARGRRGQARA